MKMISKRCLVNLLLNSKQNNFVQSIVCLKYKLFSTNLPKLNEKSEIKDKIKKSLAEELYLKKPTDYAEFKQPGSLYDPPYLNKEEPFPNYSLLNINFTSYDYISLDTFYKFVESLCKSLNINVKEAFANPARSYLIKSYKPYSTTLDKEYKLLKYHRVVCVESVTSTLAPILYEACMLNLPEGVQLSVTIPTEEEQEFRYIPDIEIQELKKSLEEATTK